VGEFFDTVSVLLTDDDVAVSESAVGVGVDDGVEGAVGDVGCVLGVGSGREEFRGCEGFEEDEVERECDEIALMSGRE
jgi:hypothetical protein